MEIQWIVETTDGGIIYEKVDKDKPNFMGLIGVNNIFDTIKSLDDSRKVSKLKYVYNGGFIGVDPISGLFFINDNKISFSDFPKPPIGIDYNIIQFRRNTVTSDMSGNTSYIKIHCCGLRYSIEGKMYKKIIGICENNGDILLNIDKPDNQIV